MRLSAAVDAYLRHLADVRRLSPATVRAYGSDLADLAGTAEDLALEDLDLEVLREWLWRATKRGDARSTIARRTASARGFFAWAAESGLIAADPSLRLIAPKRGRTLPKVAASDALGAALDDLAARAVDGDPLALRDHAMLELLYGAGIRVAELCGLDLDDLDAGRRTARVLGKGAKERVVPYGAPAGAALDAYLVRARPVLAARTEIEPGTAVFLGARGARIGPRAVYDVVTRAVSPVLGRTAGPHALRHSAATHLLTGERTSAPCRNCSDTRVSARRRSTRTCRASV
jgi:Site-specific recombinase XerD